MTKKDKNRLEDPEFGLDSRYTSKNERQSEAAALMEARLKRMKNLSGDQIARAKLMQLKLKMEEYIKHPICNNRNFFSEFLKSYIETIYSKRNIFARDIDISPVELSQVINSHREPKEEFMMKLMIHSEHVYAGICEFHKETWYQVYFNEKICGTMSSLEEWRPKIEKHIKFSESIE